MVSNGGAIPGGHLVQFTMTAEALRHLGVDVRTAIADELTDGSVDIVRGFGLNTRQIEETKRQSIPLVLSF